MLSIEILVSQQEESDFIICPCGNIMPLISNYQKLLLRLVFSLWGQMDRPFLRSHVSQGNTAHSVTPPTGQAVLLHIPPQSAVISPASKQCITLPEAAKWLCLQCWGDHENSHCLYLHWKPMTPLQLEAPLLAPHKATKCHPHSDDTKCATAVEVSLHHVSMPGSEHITSIVLHIECSQNTRHCIECLHPALPLSFPIYRFWKQEGEVKEHSHVKDLEQALWATTHPCLQAETLETSAFCSLNTAQGG